MTQAAELALNEVKVEAQAPQPGTDSILFWNAVALEANRESHTTYETKREQTGPPLSARALAIVHLAMYDAYASARGNPGHLPFYQPGLPPAPAGASPQAAVAGAAYTALVSLFPSQKAIFDAKLAEAGDIFDPGHAFGRTVANALLLDRSGDPGVDAAGYVPVLARGQHRADPDNPGQGYHAPLYGALSKGFAITSRHDAEILSPPFDDNEYRAALREVRGRGIAPELMGTLPTHLPGVQRRTVDETVIGLFWAYDGAFGLGTPPRLYNQIVRCVAMDRNNSEDDNARLFALVNAAMADAGILGWDHKYRYNLWRPVLGIREHDLSMGYGGAARNNVSDDGDVNWLPLGAPATNTANKNFTPNFPAYPSGHATFGAAALHITRLFYGVPPGNHAPDQLFADLDFVSEELDGMNRDNRGTVRPRHAREFDGGLWQMIIENGRSRVYLGVHWVFDAFAVDGNGDPDLNRKIGGVPLGLAIAEDIYANGLKTSTVSPR